MSLEIAYAAMGGDLETVRGRLLTDERIEKFAKIFLRTPRCDAWKALLRRAIFPRPTAAPTR